MNNVTIEEIREAMIEARDECSEVQSKVDDVKQATKDADCYADDADSAACNSEEKVKEAIQLLAQLTEDVEDRIDPDEVTQFLVTSLHTIDSMAVDLQTLRVSIFQRAKDWDIRLGGE